MNIGNFGRHVQTHAGLILGVIILVICFVFLFNGDGEDADLKFHDSTTITDQHVVNDVTDTTTFMDAVATKTQSSEIHTPPSNEMHVENQKPASPRQLYVPSNKQDSPVISESNIHFDSSIMLQEHNLVRSGVGIDDFVWSNVLAQSAQNWSRQLKSEGCKMRHDPQTQFGENLYLAWASPPHNNGLIHSPGDVVSEWASEKNFYTYEKNTCKSGEQCGHYTQIVWRGTIEVGCGVSSCLTGETQTDIWVCRYNPPGNDGSRPF